jgi:alpha 1,3-mannosyltransferase
VGLSTFHFDGQTATMILLQMQRGLISLYVAGIVALLLFVGVVVVPRKASKPDFEPERVNSNTHSEVLISQLELASQYFIDYPVDVDGFGELGRRLDFLGDWIRLARDPPPELTVNHTLLLLEQIEAMSLSQFPFLPAPLPNASVSHVPGSRGIVITTGVSTFRYACHLVSSIRHVLYSRLPIQIAYAGDNDLPRQYREFILSLAEGIELLDLLDVYGDSSELFMGNGWAFKPFAVLASSFQEVLLLDADAVFLQTPEIILDTHAGYKQTGALFFHDRLLWQHFFQDRHEWWREQLRYREPTEAFRKSLVQTEDYAEECDSGVVALDKGRLDVYLGLLHICWQNTKAVREKWTYRIMYGDKESWWYGLELTGVPYAFERHYGSMLGSTVNITDERGPTCCSFTIAHLDEADELLWYNGGLLKNKMTNRREFEIPTHYMVDGEWIKGSVKADMACMHGAELLETSEQQRRIVYESVQRAMEIDEAMEQEFGHL